MNASQRQPIATAAPPIRVATGTTPAERRTWEFRLPFRIGRVEECEVCIKNEYVSRAHAEVVIERGQWWIRDLRSANGLYVNGERVDSVPIWPSLNVRLGVEGPTIELNVEQPPSQQPVATETMVHRVAAHYFGKQTGDQPVGERTMAIRLAFHKVQTKQKRTYAWIMGVLAVLLLAAGSYAFYVRQQAQQQKAIAENLFYAMKSLDVDIAGVEKLVMDTQSQQGREQISRYRNRRREMERNYDQFLQSLRVYNPKLTPQERLILRVARIFGECELDMPPDFLKEVRSYIQKWQSSPRYRKGIRTAMERGYTTAISQELLDQGLPPQFFYLALQESDFDPYNSGPPTYMGIAKGMWQFIPRTAERYGLKIGPLADLRRPDPGDDRHHWERATKAAARYLKDLYSTDAQASGLLVMACYNWGEDKVLPLVRSMPANPRERNFWKLLGAYRAKVPPETYDYVYYIFSAAVIGEDPRLFGFEFDNPLGHLEGH